MRQRRTSHWPSGAALGVLLSLLAGAQAVASDFYTFTSDASVQFRLSGDGNWLSYTIAQEGPPGRSTLVDKDGATTILPGMVTGISFDGSVIVGIAYNRDAGYYQAYVLEDGVSTPIVDFVTNPPQQGLDFSRPNAVSRDGNVVIGQAGTDSGRFHAFRWSDGVLTDLGLLADAVSSNATVLSRDGAVIAGDSHVGTYDIAVVWANGATTPTALGSLGGIGSYAFAISADGSTIVGRADVTDPAQYIHAYRWTDESGMVDLGVFDGGNNSEANAVSADGSVIVGGAEIAPGQMRAFRWTEDTGLVDLGSLGGSSKGSGAYAVSDDGRVVVGGSDLAGSGTTGFRWDEENGMQSIADYLTDAGLDVTGWTFDQVGAISADGYSMAGLGNPGSQRGVWYARCVGVEEDECGVLSTANIGQSLATLAALGEAGNWYLENDFAVLGNVLASAGPGASATAYGAYDSDPATSAGVVVTAQTGDAFTAAFGLGVAHIDTPLGFGGSAGFDAASFSAALGLLPADGLTLRLSATGALLDGTVARGYLNGNTPVTSTGETTGSGIGVEGLVGWRAGNLMPDTSLFAYASLSAGSTAYAGWTESGGPFPGSIGDFATTTTLWRAGVTVDHDFGGEVSARGGFALVHRESSDTPISGVLPGVLSTSVDVSGVAADWVELSGGVALPLEGIGELQFDLMGRVPFAGSPSFTAQMGLQVPL